LSKPSIQALFPLLLALAGCSRTPPASQFPDAQAALDRMRGTYACSRGQRGEAKLDYFGSAGRVRGDLWYLTSLPDKIRFDVVSPFGATISTLTSDGERFALFDLRQKTFMRGAANACNLSRFTNVPLPPHALVQLLRGEAPLLVHEPGTARIAWEGGHYLVRIESRHSARQTIELLPLEADWNRPFAEQRLLVTGVSVEQLDVPLYKVALFDHRTARTAPAQKDPDGIDPPILPSGPACDAPVPTRIQFEVPEGDHDLRLRNQEVFHNPPLSSGAFEQELPRGVASITSPCGG
jgi:hypothetical protein